MSLLSGDELDNTKAKHINLLLRKHISKDKYDEIVIGDLHTLSHYRRKIEEFLDINIISQLNKIIDENKAALIKAVEKQISIVEQEKKA